MNSRLETLVRIVGSSVVGVVAFVAVTVLVTAGLEPYVWPSLLVGLPAGIAAGVAAFALAILGTRYYAERGTETGVSRRTTVRLWAALGALGSFVVGGVLGTAAVVLWGGGLASGLAFVGLPIGLLAAGVGGALTARFGARHSDRRRASPR